MVLLFPPEISSRRGAETQRKEENKDVEPKSFFLCASAALREIFCLEGRFVVPALLRRYLSLSLIPLGAISTATVRFTLAFFLVAAGSHLCVAGTNVPEIAKIAGIRIGADAVETVERKLGPGRVDIGGHPHGGRAWRCTPAEWSLYVDGFYYDAANHRITDTLLIEQSPPGDNAPVAKIPQQRMRFLGVVSLGMTRAEVLQAIGSRLPTPAATKDCLVWTQAGSRWINRKRYRINGWRAELRFSDNKLHAIFIEALYA